MLYRLSHKEINKISSPDIPGEEQRCVTTPGKPACWRNIVLVAIGMNCDVVRYFQTCQ
jgi:hypothetical protein